jgi:hypothetical protein
MIWKTQNSIDTTMIHGWDQIVESKHFGKLVKVWTFEMESIIESVFTGWTSSSQKRSQI